ncbi:P-loop ATPase, Sll1717 family [Streptomyces sp. NPDC017940]|uniref:P-loop ATPase, Sll1717 family n=1 Tax=Streptomyces sp. NPDC017940 TaxID=3365017 RepID=UPI00378DC130
MSSARNCSARAVVFSPCTQGAGVPEEPMMWGDVSMAALDRLYFGREDAERDVTDGLLREGFLPTAAFRAALSGRKMLIIGRKGSGKSAICVRLLEDGAHAGGALLITPDDAAGDEIRRFELQGLAGDTAKSLIWRYVFAVHAARHLVAHARGAHGRREPDSVKALRRFLKQNDEEAAETAGGAALSGGRLGDRLTQSARGLQTSLSLEAFGVRAAMDLVPSGSEGARAARQLELVEHGVARAFADLGCARAHAPLLLLIDQLEQVWSAEADSNSMVVGLLLAAKHVAGAYGRALRCLLFLRSDIYDSLSFGEGDKFRGDEVRIAWTEPALRELARTRAAASVGDALGGGPLDDTRLWQELFPPTVAGEPTPAYLFARSLPRPRDAIQFLNLCRDTAADNGHSRVEESDVLQATWQFSEWKLKDLVQEYLIAHPFLERLYPLFQNTGYTVTRGVLGNRLDEAAPTLRRLFPAYAESLDLTGVVDTLFAVGFLGVRRGNDVVYGGGGELPVQPHEGEFHVHPCFREALGATSPVDLRRYEPSVVVSRVGSGNIGYAQAHGRSLSVRPYELLELVTRSCRSVHGQVGRAVGLGHDVRDEIAGQVGRVLTDTADVRARLRADEHVDVVEHVLTVAGYFTTLAAQLLASGLDGASGSDGVAHRIDDEARRLRRLAGGASGSTGDAHV